MMTMFAKSLNYLKIDAANRFKALCITNVLDVSKDYLVSERIIALLNSHLKEFGKELMEKESPKSLKQLLRLINPAKGIKYKDQ